MTAALNIPELINMGEVMDVRNLFLKLNGYKSADLDLIYKTGMACRYAGQNFNWNERNDQVFGRKPVTFEEALFPPELPPVPKPFRSWLEVMVSLFGGLNDCEYEPRKYKMKYVTEHTYQPDWVDSLNDRLVWEGKESYLVSRMPTNIDAWPDRTVFTSSSSSNARTSTVHGPGLEKTELV